MIDAWHDFSLNSLSPIQTFIGDRVIIINVDLVTYSLTFLYQYNGHSVSLRTLYRGPHIRNIDILHLWGIFHDLSSDNLLLL